MLVVVAPSLVATSWYSPASVTARFKKVATPEPFVDAVVVLVPVSVPLPEIVASETVTFFPETGLPSAPVMVTAGAA